MFRSDKFTLKRPVAIVVEGETIWSDTPELIAENISCHLSVKAISPLNQSQSTATVLYDYVLFYDTALNLTINANDIIEVTTAQGQSYRLRAGESHKYPITTQTHCEDDSVV